jgi:hypothetical protein
VGAGVAVASGAVVGAAEVDVGAGVAPPPLHAPATMVAAAAWRWPEFAVFRNSSKNGMAVHPFKRVETDLKPKRLAGFRTFATAG